jgi:hypothetical protein
MYERKEAMTAVKKILEMTPYSYFYVKSFKYNCFLLMHSREEDPSDEIYEAPRSGRKWVRTGAR